MAGVRSQALRCPTERGHSIAETSDGSRRPLERLGLRLVGLLSQLPQNANEGGGNGGFRPRWPLPEDSEAIGGRSQP